MKTRSGFVSNSSSSSFVVAVKNGEDFLNQFDPKKDNWDQDKARLHAKGIEEVKKFQKWNYGDDLPKFEVDELNACLEDCVSRGFDVAEIAIPWGDHLEHVLDSLKSQGKLVVLQDKN